MNVKMTSQTTATNGRSTRGASKYRRDQINVEIQNLRDLLPLTDSMKDRLFQLQVMSLTCVFIRKHKYLPYVIDEVLDAMHTLPSGKAGSRQHIDGFRALRGFLLIVTKSGKIVYISENASEYLGHSVAEIMCQGDSIFDLIDVRDHQLVQNELGSGPPSASNAGFLTNERMFVCRLNWSRTAKRQLQHHKFILVEGRYLHTTEYYQSCLPLPSPIQPIFAAYCQLLINPENAEVLASGNTSVFTSIHYMDMKFIHLDPIGSHYLGFENDEIEEKSWYLLLHPAHLAEVAFKHRMLCQNRDGVALCLIQLQSRTGAWIWLHTVLAVKDGFLHQPQDARRVRQIIHVTYQVLSDSEAIILQSNSWIYSIQSESEALIETNQKLLDSQLDEKFNHPSIIASLLSAKKEISHCNIDGGSLNCNQNLLDCNDSKKNRKRWANCLLMDKNDSLNFGSENDKLDELPELCLEPTVKGPLPDLSGDLDEFFNEVEHHRSPVSAVAGYDCNPKMDISCLKVEPNELVTVLPGPESLIESLPKAPTITKLLQGNYRIDDVYKHF